MEKSWDFKISMSKFVIISLMVSAVGFFAIPRTSSIIYSSDLINVSVLVISVFSFFFSSGHVLSNKYLKSYQNWMLFTIALWITLVTYSTIIYYRYGQTLIQVLSTGYGYLIFGMLFPLAYYQEHLKDPDYLKKVIVNISLIAAILSIAQVFLYNFGITLLDIGTVTSDKFRNGTLRFGVGSNLVPFALLITLLDAINYSENRKKNWTFSVIFLIDILYASKTRSLWMYLIVTIYLVIIFFVKNKRAKLLLIFIGLIVFAYILFSGVWYNFFFDLSTDSGVNMRSNTLNFYWKEFLEHPILGMGYIKGSTATPELLSLLMGPLWYGKIRYYYRSDVGFVGLINESGIIGAIWYISIIHVLLKQSLYLLRKNNKKYIWSIGSVIYIILCSVNLIYTDSGRFVILMLVVALINHYYLLEQKRE
ncbi:O-antigen ligase family protein [Lactobacillus delbrueckii]|jgi:O-antigen ligase|uniref:O-antigen ligase family protein n=1 Tax=Lactobacillus delbrueckii TaxID=1584 RepID=UPI001F3791BC|nr:O-antigen ligase family protein [Lactobacillus delbrueckii]